MFYNFVCWFGTSLVYLFGYCVSYSRFSLYLLNIFTIAGCVDRLQKHAKFKDGKRIWQKFETCVTEGNLSLNFLKDVQQQKEKLSTICTILHVSSNQSERESWRQIFLDKISKLEQIEKDCSQRFFLLESIIKYGRKVSEDIHPVDGVSQLISEFNNRKDNWRTKKLCELRDQTFWGPLFSLLNPAISLQLLMKSVSFTNVAKICLQENFDPVRPDNEGEETLLNDFHSLVKFLTSKAIERLQAQWNPVFRDPGSLTLETMNTLLGSLKSEEKLEKELTILQQYFNRRFSPDVMLYIKDYVTYPNVLKHVKQIIAVMNTFGFIDPENDTLSTLTSFEMNVKDDKTLNLRTLHNSMESVLKIVSTYTGEDLDGTVEELGRSSELLAFIEEIVDEDIRFLIDAVEEHSDQFVSESSVSDLIDVHGFVAPLIKKRQQGWAAEQFLSNLKEASLAYKDMAIKVQQCSTNVNSLRGLYTSVANRGEITKEIIASGLKRGVYIVSLKDDGTCEAKMSYVYEKTEKNKSANQKTKSANQKNKSASYSLPELHDLRSRAHLIVTSDKNVLKRTSDGDKESIPDINFANFITQVNLLTEITTLLLRLRLSGYIKYRKFWKRMKGTNVLQATRDQLQEDLANWESILSNAREKYYFLNYYRSDQLCTLHDFLTNRSQVNNEDVLSLIHFVDPNVKKELLEDYRTINLANKQNNTDDNPHTMISLIGNALDDIFANTSPIIRPILDDQVQLSFNPSKIDATVKSGELYVVSLESESPLTANVILTLYENTSNAFPEPYQVVFCGPQTTWEEIYLFLQRCFAQSKHLKRDSLFCIANVELLANEAQFKLVNAIKEKQNSDYGSLCVEVNADYLLALICRGGDHHHIVQQFVQYSHHIAAMSDLALSARLKSGWPEVRMITSTLPGLGKTEIIKREVLEKNMNVVTFSVSGPLDQSKLIQRLKNLNLKKYHCLHLDVGEVSDPLWLDTFLFQLIVTGMVSSGTQLYHLATSHVYIEIANTLKDWLRESLVISKYFTRVHLQWRNYEDLLVSSEITSKLQVVCQYFDIFDRARLESADIHFSGPQKVKPLPASRCRELLVKYYSSDADITFTALNTFLGVLADQLLKFSRSAFFKIANLKSMLGEGAHGVRTNLFRALLDVSKEFASRAITTCRSSNLHVLSQKESAKALDKAVSSNAMSAQNMVERVEGMIQWEDSNHLLVVFHGTSSQAIAAVYRNKALVPLNVEQLLNSQVVRGKKKELEDFKLMSQDQLQEKLERIACTKPVKKCEDDLYSSYALTPDNILKMILIILRVRANVPVIIMGETGCGKTSLVRYLANKCQIQFFPFNFHAGITEEEVTEFVITKENQAREGAEQIWVFLDEINTCDHLGLISDVMCHHSLLGRPLSKNLVFLAACNPYKLRPKEQIKTAGLEGKNITDQYSGLVYRVHPLPEAMIDYVWDYGSLAPNDEKAYIQRMVRKLPKKHVGLLVDLLAESQKFIRDAERNHFCVSLRDVHRCILLIHWFTEMIDKREKTNRAAKHVDPKHLRKYRLMSERYDDKPVIKSIVLALAHCYLSRLPTDKLRRSYRERMMKLFCGNGTIMTRNGEVDSFSAIVRMEEEDYLDRMELPPGTARNAALRENVFVMLVCILNRIPIFVVGKPGCSKSLSIQLIRSNLRGRDSKDPLFRSLPQLYVVSYQGSESSTSEGIIKVFDKARKYKSHNKDGNVLPVVLLDEVGLAENSKYNPLKVLHSLLEPGDGQLPDVAVVGISNWSLDAAKMNRAIHLSRPEPTIHDLYETGYSLHYADSKDVEDYSENFGKDELRCLAEAYFEYQSKQKYANFHGLRDYYSLIKSLSLSGSSDLQQINLALQRNFGGIPGELTNIQKIFLDKLKNCMLSSGEDIIPVTKLIQENLVDSRARHLMLITSGDSAIGILKQNLTQLKKETITIFGSHFEEDLSEDYNYRILSRIILCMERDCVLILRDLESIYGSLYDMLNQNYAVVGKRKNCRVALGAYSNPMCYVNDGFRCIVLTDHHKVDFSDPPFLNRFEKQLLRFSDVLNEKQQKMIIELCRWVRQISTVQGLESHFKEPDMFIGFHEDTLPSLVLSNSHCTEESTEEIIKKCKDDLMWVAAPDAVLRAQKCDRLKEDSEEVKKLSDEYFRKPIHQGFASFIETAAANQLESPYLSRDEIGSKTIVMTFSNIHTDIPKCLGDIITCQAERLSAFKSEKQLAERVNHFWLTSEAELLVLQCKPELDGGYMLLARSIIEDKRNSYKQACRDPGVKPRKHVCIVVHLQRGTTSNNVQWQFSFLCGWKQVFLDVLEAPPVSLNEIRSESIQTLLTSSIWPLRKLAQNDLLWCFTCIKYTRNQRSFDTILHYAKNLFNSDSVYPVIEQLLLQWVNTNCDEAYEEAGFSDRWQVKVACDRQALINSSTLYCAMEHHVSRLVREPLAKIVYFLEKENAWPPHVLDLCEDDALKSMYEELWCDLILKEPIIKITEIPKPLGTESYVLDSPTLDLHLPFSQVVIRRVDGVKDLFLEDYAQVRENESNFDKTGQLMPNVQQQLINRYSEIIPNFVPEIYEFSANCRDSYMDDLFDVVSADFSATIVRKERVSTIKAAFMSHVKRCIQMTDALPFYVQLHIFVWISKERILDLIRMVDGCRPFIDPEILNLLTNSFLQTNSDDIWATEMYSESEGEEGSEDKSKDYQEPKLQDEATEICTKYVDEYRLEDRSTAFQEPKLKDRATDVQTELEDHNGSVDGRNASQEFKPQKGEADEAKNNQKILSKLAGHQESLKQEEEDVVEGTNENCEDNKLAEDQECFEDRLVTVCCEEMLPSKETVQNRNGGLESWIRNACLLLSLAFKISDQTPAFHYLRLCVDFAKIVLASSTPEKESLFPLYILNEIGARLKPGYLDAEESFQEINEYLIRPLEQQMKEETAKHEALQKFSALFYGRCLDTNVDTCGARLIVEQVLSLDRADLVMMMGPVILRLLMVEELESPGVFGDIIANPGVINECPCLQNIDEVLKDLFSKCVIHHDSYSAVMICDLIQSLLNFDNLYSIEDIDSSDCELLRRVNHASKTLSVGEQDNCGLVLLSAVAFLRAFFTMLSRFIVEKANVLKADSSYAYLMNEINSVITVAVDSIARRLSLRIFFLKQLSQKMSLFDLRKLCCESETLPAIKSVWNDDKDMNKAEFVSVSKHPEYQQVKAAYWNLYNDDDSKMLNFLDQCQNSPNHRLALLGILMNMIYLKRTVRKLTDKEERFADWFSEKVKVFPSPLKELLLRIIGRKDFNCPQLQLSPESSVEEVETALLILHISCVVASGMQELTPLYQYLTTPLKCKDNLIVAHGEDRIRQALEMRKSANSPRPFTCVCGLRILFKDDREEDRCPYCGERAQPDPEKTNNSIDETTNFSTKGYLPVPTKNSSQWDACMDSMNPSVFRALHLIVHASFYSGVAIEITSQADLSSLLKLHEVSSSETWGYQDAAEFCFEHITTDLSILALVLGCKTEIAVKVMHLVVEKSTELLRGKSLCKNTCSTEQQRLDWEAEFSNLTEGVLQEALGSAKVIKKEMRMKQTEENEASTTLQVQIQELDDYPAEPEQQNQQLKRLFRLTREPTFEEFRANFVNSPKDFQEKHSFLLLFFAKFDELPQIGNLYHLLKWARLVSSALTHRISRKEAQSKSINDFIYGHILELKKSQDEVESQKKLFNNFKEAWNAMRKLVNEELSEDGKEMPRLRETDYIAYCLTESHDGIYLRTAIRILASLQNSILDEMLILSALQKHPALHFFEKDDSCSGISSVSFQEVKEKEIINFQWSDELFKYAQINPEYGKGEEINYDFERIEIELASDIAFGKRHLTESLNKFIFSKELFHSCGPLLAEIRDLFPQSTRLPDDVRQGLASLKERRIKEAQDLLQHIEVLIFLLKLKLKNIDMDMTLETFAENWLSMLPSPFPVSLLPQPRSSIKLTHVAALYEALEDMLADGAIEGLPDQFREDLPSESKQTLDCLVDKEGGQLKLQTFVNALRRFVFRYLSSEKFLPAVSTTLSSCLKEPSLWTPEKPPNPDVIPKELTLENLLSTLTHLQELEKVMY